MRTFDARRVIRDELKRRQNSGMWCDSGVIVRWCFATFDLIVPEWMVAEESAKLREEE